MCCIISCKSTSYHGGIESKHIHTKHPSTDWYKNPPKKQKPHN